MFHKRLLKEFSDNRKYVAGMVIMQWAALLANVALMYVLAAYVGRISGIVKGESLTTSPSDGVLLIVFAAALFVRIAATSAANRMSYLASTQVKRRLRDRIYEKMMEFGAAYREAVATSEAVQIATEGVDQLEIYFGKYVPQFFYSMLAPLTLFVIVGTMSIKVAAVLLLCVPLIPVSIVAVQKFAKKLLAKYWGTYTELGDSFLENLQGLTTLKIYQADEWKQQEMNKEAENFRKITMKVLTMQLNSVSVMDLIAYGGAALGSIVAILGFQNGSLSLFQVICIVLLSSEFFIPLRLLGSFFHIAMNGIAASDKVFRILDKPQKQAEQKQWKAETVDIQLRDLSFSYDEQRTILKHVYMQLKPGQFTAIVGESGSGKSTIAKLIAGIVKDYHGQLLIADTQRRDIDDDAFYQSFLYVSHQPFIFKGSVRENLAIAKDSLSEEAMLEALRKVALLDFVMEQGGLDMELQEQGNNLSGGQKQRLSIARALLAQRDVYIFDEAASNIDAESEDAIVSVIHKLAETKTVIMITHRLKSIKGCDQIYVIEQGTCQEHGRHEELLRLRGTYARMYEKQQELEAMEGAEQYA